MRRVNLSNEHGHYGSNEEPAHESLLNDYSLRWGQQRSETFSY